MLPDFLDFKVDEVHIEMANREFAEIELLKEFGDRMNVACLLYTSNSAHEDWKRSILDLIGWLQAECNHEFNYLGISAPGIPNGSNTMISYMPGRLHGLEYFDWKPYLSKRTFVLNDANAALLAESRIGSLKGKGTKHAIMITLGTGMGGAILIDNKIYTGMGQKGGHLGHITIDINDTTPGITGQPGNIEEAIGDCSIHKRSNGIYNSTKDLVHDYESGDTFAKTIWPVSYTHLDVYKRQASMCAYYGNHFFI